MYTPTELQSFREYYAGTTPLMVREYYPAGNGTVNRRDREVALPVAYENLDQAKLNEATARRLDEINETYTHIKVGEYTFEVATVNSDKASETIRYEGFGSTLGSNLSTNVLNAVEFARRGVVRPDIPQVYIAFSGNGGSSPMYGKVAKDFNDSGRITTEDKNGQPYGIEPVQRLVEGLLEAGIILDGVTGDSAGSTLLMGAGAEQARRGSPVRVGLFNNRPQLFDRTFRQMLAVIPSDKIDGRILDEFNTPDLLSVAHYTKDDEAQFKKRLDRIYGDENQREVVRISQGLYGMLGKLMLAARAFGRGPKQGNPLLQDTQSFIDMNPSVHAAFVFPGKDYLNGSPDQIEQNVQAFLGGLSIRASVISAYVPNLTHNYDKHFFSVREALFEQVAGG